ncbi:hypothetical protein DICPUDRAFT_154346 [Dictyostelium purpureum]|uniref:Fibronectin type-III domain-containing protein n=1 Tax=Dictyostelium purpureum TaxID=5786 RepID=F0ZR42_DICPU|nr:uncharacterized protein DICPUDRAFT_154346 [Dictyostelium purpureum]EGC33582.1 hypothetical protein DICPUDRAFT_154346 [Dictyostelium purpureum]|eukprot:XP_003289897.1 hypothetical protein DICPUDRAFT_154346 [Dictyostelium purpureum]
MNNSQNKYKYSIDSWKTLNDFKLLKLNEDPIFNHLMQSLYSIQQFNKDIINNQNILEQQPQQPNQSIQQQQQQQQQQNDISIYLPKNSEELLLNDKINSYIEEVMKRFINSGVKKNSSSSSKHTNKVFIDSSDESSDDNSSSNTNNQINDIEKIKESFLILVDPLKRNYYWINGIHFDNNNNNNNNSTSPLSSPSKLTNSLQENEQSSGNLNEANNIVSIIVSNQDIQSIKYIANQTETNPLTFYSLLSSSYNSKSIVIPYLNNSGNVPNKCSLPNVEQVFRNDENQTVKFLLNWECDSVVREYSLMMKRIKLSNDDQDKENLSTNNIDNGSGFEVLYRGHNNFYTTPPLQSGVYSFKVKAVNRFGAGEPSEEFIINETYFQKTTSIISSSSELSIEDFNPTESISNNSEIKLDNNDGNNNNDSNNDNNDHNNDNNNDHNSDNNNDNDSNNDNNNYENDKINIGTDNDSNDDNSINITNNINNKTNSKDKKRKKTQAIKFKKLISEIDNYITQNGRISTRLSIIQCEEIINKLSTFKEKYTTSCNNFSEEEQTLFLSSVIPSNPIPLLERLETIIESANQLLLSYKMTKEWREILKNEIAEYLASPPMDPDAKLKINKFVDSLSDQLPETVKNMIYQIVTQTAKKKLNDTSTCATQSIVRSKASYLLTIFSNRKDLFNTTWCSEMEVISKQLLENSMKKKKSNSPQSPQQPSTILLPQTTQPSSPRKSKQLTKNTIAIPQSPQTTKLQINTTPTKSFENNEQPLQENYNQGASNENMNINFNNISINNINNMANYNIKNNCNDNYNSNHSKNDNNNNNNNNYYNNNSFYTNNIFINNNNNNNNNSNNNNNNNNYNNNNNNNNNNNLINSQLQPNQMQPQHQFYQESVFKQQMDLLSLKHQNFVNSSHYCSSFTSFTPSPSNSIPIPPTPSNPLFYQSNQMMVESAPPSQSFFIPQPPSQTMNQFSPSSWSSNSTTSSPSNSPSIMLNSLSDQIYTDFSRVVGSQGSFDSNNFIVSPPSPKNHNSININDNSNEIYKNLNSDNHFGDPNNQFQWLTPVLSNLETKFRNNTNSNNSNHSSLFFGTKF